MHSVLLGGILSFLIGAAVAAAPSIPANELVFPGANWESRSPEAVGLSREKFVALQQLVGGRGCVVRHGYMVHTWGDQTKSSDVASAVKPLISTLLFVAIQEGKLRSVDDKVADFEIQLRQLNNGKEADITWRHLAFQTSGYGLFEAPGRAYAYNDYALALYYDMLTKKVFGTNGTDVLQSRLAGPLQFEDACTFDAFGPNNRPGRLAISVRDFARFGLLYLRNGNWRGKQILKPEFIHMATTSALAAATPLTSGREAPMLPGQRSIGGTRNITPVGPGCYSFNWWINATNASGQRLFVDAPPDTYVASGHGGKRALWIVPSLDLIACWNDSQIDDHDKSPGNALSKNNQAARLLAAAVLDKTDGTKPATRLGIEATRFTINGRPAFLYGISYYSALAASEEFIRRDLDDMRRRGFNWIRVWANWRAFGADAAAVDEDGHVIPQGMHKLKWLARECDRRGIAVDVTLSRGNGVTGPPRLQSLEAHHRAVEALVTALKPFQNWYLDLSNERNIRDKRFASIEDLRSLRERVRQLDSERLVTASHAGDITPGEMRDYLQTIRVDFVSPHRPRAADSAAQTETKTAEYLRWMKEMNRMAPVHYQEPFRRGFGNWQPVAMDLITDARNAKKSGAAGWCFHNGDRRGQADGEPRRSFDLRAKRLFDQLDAEELQAIESLKDLLP